ncbi:PREDICTED: putative nuclease HARBI1 [Cyphomyrmex costatus]|uniref:putative nuclease HARBI1 n=1 Tax=Cyphomyrmex costatus TaxID=456900 RepID=UPI0008523599|nr:PREDICTED: putative nuclease HARBI1 [Cyphomyrmex costatus]
MDSSPLASATYTSASMQASATNTSASMQGIKGPAVASFDRGVVPVSDEEGQILTPSQEPTLTEFSIADPSGPLDTNPDVDAQTLSFERFGETLNLLNKELAAALTPTVIKRDEYQGLLQAQVGACLNAFGSSISILLNTVGLHTSNEEVKSILTFFVEVWPTENKIQETVLGFSNIRGFPDTIGAIDGTHINIPSPKENAEAYVNRKGHYSIQLQAVCDHKRQFTHIYVGNVGSIHDARVFRSSPLEEYIKNPDKFPNNTHLIGDAAYKLHQHILTPYTDNGHLTQRQKNYNFCHSSTRMTIERAFALLKCRWRSLLHTLAMYCIELIPYHILACCVLHNICLLRRDELQLQDVAVVIEVEEALNPLQRFECALNGSHPSTLGFFRTTPSNSQETKRTCCAAICDTRFGIHQGFGSSN